MVPQSTEMRLPILANRGSDDDYYVSTDPRRIDRDLVHRFLSEESVWARGIQREVSDRAIENSLCFGLYSSRDQVGFARVVTDYATFAYVEDVFVVEAHRCGGLAGRLVNAMLSHPDLGASSPGGCWLARRRQGGSSNGRAFTRPGRSGSDGG